MSISQTYFLSGLKPRVLHLRMVRSKRLATTEMLELVCELVSGISKGSPTVLK